MASNKRDSASPINANSTPIAGTFLKNTGKNSRETQTSKKLRADQPFLIPMFGQEDSLAKTSRWREWARELDLEGSNLDYFMNLLDLLNSVAPEFFSSKMFRAFSLPTKEEISRSSYGLWSNSGIAWDGVCLTAKTSESPNLVKESSLWDAMEKGQVPQKYFLSPNAAKGILRRADRMGRELFPPLRKALETLSEVQL